MDNMGKNLLDEYRENRWQTENETAGKGGGFWIALSAAAIILAGFIFCANNKLLHADELLEKIRNVQIGSVTVSQLYEQVAGEDGETDAEETPLG